MKLNFKGLFVVVTALVSLAFSVTAFAKTADVVYFDEKCDSSVVASAPNGATVISVVPSNDSLKIGDEFYVDFVLKNNPGFAAFGFTINYDNSVIVPVKGDADALDDVSQVTYGEGDAAVSAYGINEGIDIGKSSGSFVYTNLLLRGSKVFQASGDGILFRVNFKTIGNGSSNILLSDRSGDLLIDSNAMKFPVYVENAAVTVSGGNAANIENNDNTATTEVSIDNNLTEKNTEKNTDNDNNVENTTENIIKNDVEVTTETSSTDVANKVTDENISDNKNLNESEGDFIINFPREMSTPREFGDLASVPWAKQSISSLSALGIVNGVDDVTFNPKAYTYRADFVLAVTRLLGLDGQGENVFSDVDNSAYYSKAVSLANKFQIVMGADGKFMPKDNITRQDVMVILSRVLDKAGKLQKGGEASLKRFIDASDISGYAMEPVADLIYMGVVSGDDNSMIKPKGYINRAEMAVLIERVYNVLNN